MAVQVLFYAVPEDRPCVPPTFFRTCWFEAIDGWVRLPEDVGVGTPDIGKPRRTDRREWQVAPGQWDLPDPPLAPIEGTADQWARGTLYSEYVLGRYGPMRQCVPHLASPAPSYGLCEQDWPYPPLRPTETMAHGQAEAETVPVLLTDLPSFGMGSGGLLPVVPVAVPAFGGSEGGSVPVVVEECGAAGLADGGTATPSGGDVTAFALVDGGEVDVSGGEVAAAGLLKWVDIPTYGGDCPAAGLCENV